MLQFGLRLGKRPRVVITTTPRPVKIIREMLGRQDVVVSRGTSFENKDNLPPQFFSSIVRRYQGTRLGRQELEAELLEDVPGALWTRDRIEELRRSTAPQFRRLIVALDPSGSNTEESDEVGIIVAGLDESDEGWVLVDASGKYSPVEWGKIAVGLYHKYRCDRIIAERNYGGDMVEAVIRMVDPNVSFSSVVATRGKTARAEPVSAIYEQGRAHHLGAFSKLEDEMCAFTSNFDRSVAGYSPNRVDALVWAFSELFIAPMKGYGIFEFYRQMAGELTARETALIEAPSPIQQRHAAILAERSRYAALMADRPPTPEESAEHVAAIDQILTANLAGCVPVEPRPTRRK